MAHKQFLLDDQPLTIYKRRGSRNLRLSIAANGEVRVTIPSWAPYQSGLTFARSRQAWIKAQQPAKQLLTHGHSIGKAHRLHFKPDGHKLQSRVSTMHIVVSHPINVSSEALEVQQAAHKASIRALRVQAEQLLPQRLATLASQHKFNYQSVRIKQLKSRWGSCDQQRNIVLNLYLMQLPWELIDYVLLHELVHTQVLKHGPQFWSAMETVLPDAKQRRQALKAYQPTLS